MYFDRRKRIKFCGIIIGYVINRKKEIYFSCGSNKYLISNCFYSSCNESYECFEGTLVPNRIFVGGISASTTESELMQLFSTYGAVKAVKIIMDRAGVSKGYGFITFENEEVARRLQRDTDSILFKERKLNIAPAVKKQVSVTFDVGAS